MTRINDYLWHLPHAATDDDPPDVQALQRAFNAPLVAALEEPLAAQGYRLSSHDVAVQLDSREAYTQNTYRANVRFICHLEPDVIARVHFEHVEWAHFLMGSETHRYFVNLDRFKLADLDNQIPVPAWPGRLHTRMSSLPNRLHHDGDDQLWAFASALELDAQMQLFLDKFARQGRYWLEDRATF
jgi:hypothetical protein